ncbi:MAG: class II aldolase/adducin family protein [Candidatus Sumerlaeia bacterium]|nr:class II aldolase/adducin family protein [Candidatus Sumerlaeia bacterium]
MNELEQRLREAFCEVGRRVWDRGYVASNDGNFSQRVGENRVLATPTMSSKGFMRPEDMVVVDLDGRQLEGHRRLTSEIKAHLFIYRERPDVRCVVHAHPPHGLAFAIARRPLPRCVVAEAEVNLGPVPLVPYATTGTWDFARSLAPWVRNHDAFLLANHGAIVVGHDPFDAYYRLETLDQYARILLNALQLGDLHTLDLDSMEELLSLKERMGSADPRRHAETPVCGDDVPPTPAHYPAAELRFRPLAHAPTDAPKASTLAPPPPRAPMPGHRPDIEEATWETMRRLRGE